jgi:hypothetical protein
VQHLRHRRQFVLRWQVHLTDVLQQFSFVRSVRLQADHHGPAKAGHYVLMEDALVSKNRQHVGALTAIEIGLAAEVLITLRKI